MRLFVFFADKLLLWGRRVEQEAGYRLFAPARRPDADRSLRSMRQRDEGPPEHWARLVASVPPRHWLDLLQQATDAQEESFVADSEPQLEEASVFAVAENAQSLRDRSDVATESEPRQLESPQNRSEYSANREARRGNSELASPAIGPASYLNRLRFSAEAPEPREAPGNYVEAQRVNPPTPSFYPESSAGSEKRQTPAPRVATPFEAHDESSFQPPGAKRLPAEDLANEARAPANPNQFSATKPTQPMDRAQSPVRPAARNSDQVVGSESQQRYSRPMEKSRAIETATEARVRLQSIRNRSLFKRIEAPTSSISRSEYHQTTDPNEPITLSFPAESHSPGTKSGSNRNQLPVTHNSSATRFSEETGHQQPAVQSMNLSSFASEEGRPSRREPAALADASDNLWPTLPPASGFDLADDLLEREAESNTLRRLEQEQRGILWSE